MSSSGLDPNVPLPPVDEDSDLVGENNERGVPDDDPTGGERPAGLTLPIAGAGAFPVAVPLADQVEEAAGGDAEPDDEE
jgi:hypothetical protein